MEATPLVVSYGSNKFCHDLSVYQMLPLKSTLFSLKKNIFLMWFIISGPNEKQF